MKGTDKDLGGTIRLSMVDLKDIISRIYSALMIKERHRHRYEVNINYKEKILKIKE